MLGVRLTFLSPTMVGWLKDGTADWFWPAAEKAGLPVMFLASMQGPAFERIAERHPKLTLIVDHMGVTSAIVNAGRIGEAIKHTLSLAKYPNVSVKLSASPLMSKEPYPFKDMTPHIRALFEAYGARRCYWGTDITNSFNKATYRQRITHFTETLDFLSEDDKDWVMGRSILEKLKWA
jgi:predicted TIM-barrel fold metal-dependent hydrolase